MKAEAIILRSSAAMPDRAGEKAAAGDPAAFAAAMSAAQAGARHAAVSAPDFTAMTSLQMREWVNEEIRAGRMSLDESRPFMAMTMKVPVGGTGAASQQSGGERVDFMQRAREGMEAARLRGDEYTRSLLEAALARMDGDRTAR